MNDPIVIVSAARTPMGAFQGAFAGLTETRGATQDSFWTWREVMYRFLDRLYPHLMQLKAEREFVLVGERHQQEAHAVRVFGREVADAFACDGRRNFRLATECFDADEWSRGSCSCSEST